MDKREIEGKDTRRRHGEEFKRELVERSLQPGASVSALAQEHGVNANLLFNWRRLKLRALAAKTAAPLHPALLPVTVVPELPPVATPPAPAAAFARRPNGTIEIEIGGTRVRVRGNVDDTSLRSVLRALRELA
jgi:transposase